MKKNVGNLDRVIRFLMAAVMVGLYFMHIVTGVAGVVLLVLAAVLVLTSFVGLCPLYALFGVSTCARKVNH